MPSINDCTVADLMTKTLHLVKESISLADAIALMVRDKASSLIVEKSHDKDAFGIITRKDIVMEAAENWSGFATLKVHDLATKPAISIQSSVGIKHAIRLMRLVGVRRLLVTHGEQLVGILSNTDIFGQIASEVGAAGK